MNEHQKRALQERLLEEIVDIYGDNFLTAATSLTHIGHDVSSAISKALIQVPNNPKFGLRSFLKSCNETAILQMATHCNIAMPDASGRFIGEGVQARWEQRFNERDFHADVVTHSKTLFLNEHYANAVHETCKVYIRALQAKSGSRKDGAELMSVLSPKGNVKFNAYLTDSEKNYQQGLEYISRGVVSAFRNITAHDMAKSLDMSPIETLEMLSTVSLLLKALDKATVSDTA